MAGLQDKENGPPTITYCIPNVRCPPPLLLCTQWLLSHPSTRSIYMHCCVCIITARRFTYISPVKSNTLQPGNSKLSLAPRARRASLEGGLPAWAPRSATLSSSSGARGRRPSLAGGAPPWAPQQQPTHDGSASTPSASDNAPKQMPSFGGGLPSWAPADKKAGAVSGPATARRRRSSLDGGMPAWAPDVVSTSTARASQIGLTAESVESGKTDTFPVLPDWLAAAAGQEVRKVSEEVLKPRCCQVALEIESAGYS